MSPVKHQSQGVERGRFPSSDQNSSSPQWLSDPAVSVALSDEPQFEGIRIFAGHRVFLTG
jgi:hypothetical protein